MSVSVIIPAHNAADFLGQALESALAQTLAPQEIVVYDDGSTDGTAALLADYAARYPGVVRALGGEGPSRGAAFARNRAMEAARGEFLAFLDADDLWLPEKLERQLEAHRRQAGDCVVFGQIQEFDENGPRGPFKGAAVTLVCFLRRELARRTGSFEESLALGDFADWLARLQELPAEFVYLELPLARRRIHSQNLGKRSRERRGDYLEVIRRRLHRKRG